MSSSFLFNFIGGRLSLPIQGRRIPLPLSVTLSTLTQQEGGPKPNISCSSCLSFLAWFCFAPRIFHSASPSVLSRVQLKFFDPYQSTFFEPWRWIWISFFRKFFAPSVNNQPEDSFYGVLNEPQILWAFVANSLRLLSLFNDLWSFIRKFFAPLFFFTGPSH